MDFEYLKKIFKVDPLLSKADVKLSEIPSLEILKNKLEIIALKNEILAEQSSKDTEKLDEDIISLEIKIAEEELTPHAKTVTLRNLRRLLKQRDDIYKIVASRHDNMDLHLTVLRKIQQIESLGTKAVEGHLVDEIQVEFDEQQEEHDRLIDAVSSMDSESEHRLRVDTKELEDLERDILSRRNPDKLKSLEPESPKPQEQPEVKAVQESRPSIEVMIERDNVKREAKIKPKLHELLSQDLTYEEAIALDEKHSKRAAASRESFEDEIMREIGSTKQLELE